MDIEKVLPKYRCHKIVGALKIAVVGINNSLTPEDESYPIFHLPPEYFTKHNPHAGGYYVVYEDGYASFSPASAFENGYTKIEHNKEN